MNLSARKKYDFNIYMVIYSAFILTVILSDYIYYVTKVNYNIVLCIGLIGIGVLSVLYARKIGFVRTDYNVLDILFIILLLGVCIWRGVMPEMSFDTSNYHIYFQGDLGRDFINDDFFAVRAVNAQTLALGDRMFGVFRRILGYRMGTMLNTFVVVAIYFQLKKIVVLFCETIGFTVNEFANSVIVFICLQTENIYSLLATYMIDLLAVPIVLQLLLMVWEINRDEEYVKGEALCLCIMAGVLASIKISNLFAVFPLAVLYLYKRWGKLSVKAVCAGLVGALLMVALYICISIDLTGNPLFPYANSIFGSEWFTTEYSPNDLSAFNSRFGPEGLLQIVLWPLYMVLRPERTSDIVFCSGRMLVISVIFILFGISKSVKAVKDKNVKFFELMAVMFIYYLLFVFVLGGYMRYILVLELVGSVVALGLVAEKFNKRGMVRSVVTACVCVLFVGQVYIAEYKYMRQNYEWSWRNIFDVARVKANAEMVFKDYGSGVDQEIIDDIQTLLVADHSGSLAYMLKPEAEIINLTSGNTNEYTTNILWERLNDMPDDGIYSLGKSENLVVGNYVGYGLKISEMISVQPDFCDSVYTMPLIKLEKSGEIRSIEARQGNSYMEFGLSAEDSKLELFVGNNPGSGKYSDEGFAVTVSLYDNETGALELVNTLDVVRLGYYNKIAIELDPNVGWDKLVVTKDNSNVNINYVYCAAVLQRY